MAEERIRGKKKQNNRRINAYGEKCNSELIRAKKSAVLIIY